MMGARGYKISGTYSAVCFAVRGYKISDTYNIMKKTNYGYGLDQQISGMSVPQFLADMIERNEREEINNEKMKNNIAALNTSIKYSRACMDARNLDARLARKDAELASIKAELAEERLRVEKSKRKRKR